MTEGELIEQLVEFQNVLLLGVSVFFTVVSAYMVSLYTFLGRASFLPRLFAFLFLTMTVGFLLSFLYGAGRFHTGLIDTLDLMAQRGERLTPAGEVALANNRAGIDEALRLFIYVAAFAFYLGLSALTFWTGWRKPSRNRIAET